MAHQPAGAFDHLIVVLYALKVLGLLDGLALP